MTPVTAADLTVTASRARTTAEVMESVRRFARDRATTPQQRDAFDRALRGLTSWADSQGWIFFVHLPLLVHGAVTGDERPAAPLATAMTALYVGMDILDDLADGDEPEHWAGWSVAETNLIGVTFVVALPQLAILEADAPAERVLLLQRTLAEAGLRMSAGQQLDLGRARADDVALADVAAAAAGKTGEQCALFARLAALLAGAPAATTDAFTRMAHAYGMALQLLEDCHTLFDGERSRDLDSGVRSYPIAWHLDRLLDDERRRFVQLLDRARVHPDAQHQVRRELRGAGALRAAAVTAEFHCARARRALADASPREPAAAGLRAMIESKSWFTA